MDNANGNASGSTVTAIDAPAPTRNAGAPDSALGPGMQQSRSAGANSLSPGAASRPGMIAPYHVHGSTLEGGDSPAVLAQPAAALAEGQGSPFRPEPHAVRAVHRAKRALSGTRSAVSSKYRQASEHTDDYVHDNPWKSVTLAAVGGLLIGLLISR
jgi:ElaB/YqjD/DUF883 family membrane-anchored ribosome-binding protein